MTHYHWTMPTARKRHRCGLCYRAILPGEQYGRMAGLDNGTAWTYKSCRHCIRVSEAWYRATGEDEWEEERIFEWLEDEYPPLWASLRAHWRYPDGELLPLPFTPRCIDCGTAVPDGHLWCATCDEARIARLDRQFAALANGGGSDGEEDPA